MAPRMKRTSLFRYLAFGLGALLVVTSISLVILNRWRYILAYHETPNAHRSATINRGCIDLSWAAVHISSPQESGVLFVRSVGDSDPQFGSLILRPRVVWRNRNKLVRIPLWIPCAAGIVVVCFMLPRRSRAVSTACAACGYDRRGLTDQPCPECGTLEA